MVINVESSKSKKKISIPDSWDTCPTVIYQKIVTEWDGKDLVKLFSILTSVEYSTLRNMHSYLLEEQLIRATQFVYKEATFKARSIPETFIIRGKTINVPRNVRGFTIGQSIKIRQALDGGKVYIKDGKEIKIFDEFIALAVATYLQPLLDGGDFNEDRADELVKTIEQMPITQTYALGFFLLRRPTRNGWLSRILSNLQLTHSLNL